MLEEVVERENMRAAYQQVKRNAGAPGIDGMSVDGQGPYLTKEWQRIKEALLDGRYMDTAEISLCAVAAVEAAAYPDD